MILKHPIIYQISFTKQKIIPQVLILSISLADTELYFHEEAGPVVLCPSESESRQPVALDTPRYPDKPVSVWDHAG